MDSKRLNSVDPTRLKMAVIRELVRRRALSPVDGRALCTRIAEERLKRHPASKVQRCSFCGKERTVISKPSAYICEFCLVEMQYEQREKLRQRYYDQISLEQARVLGNGPPAPKRTRLYPYPSHDDGLRSLFNFCLDQARALQFPAKFGEQFKSVGKFGEKFKKVGIPTAQEIEREIKRLRARKVQPIVPSDSGKLAMGYGAAANSRAKAKLSSVDADFEDHSGDGSHGGFILALLFVAVVIAILVLR
ncbi:MAG: hypothetical protein WA350_02205 [Candidatus Sulfotelmatobacter sp.]|jgi:ribosomal protein S14